MSLPPADPRPRAGGLSRLPIASKLLLVSAVYVAIIAGLLGLLYLSLEFQSSVRAFVGGEGLWSKAQKDAVNHLVTYTLLERPEDFELFRRSMAVPLGDRKARRALSAPEPDLAAADAGFVEGRNHPDDARAMSRLFLRFGWLRFMAEAIAIWEQADAVIDELLALGDRIDAEVKAGNLDAGRREAIVREISALNDRFTVLEDSFSFTLGRAARFSRVATGVAMLVLTAIALGAGLWISTRVSRGIGSGVLALRDGARRVAAGDFSRRIDVASADEIGELAVGFNRMTDSLVAQIGELEEKERALAEMDRLKSQFFANVSHELRTPLALILGPARRLFENDGLVEADRRGAAVIEKNAQLLLKHVNDLLDLSRIDAGAMAPERAPLDLARVARRVASHFEALADERTIRLDVDAPARLDAELDRVKIERVLFNLLANAFKFTPDGTWVRLALRERGAERERVEIIVEDGGPGIPETMRARIFERFRQVDGDATRRHGGTGLGLAIAREFVELHHGTIRAEAAQGGGARLVIELPRLAPAGAALRASEPEPEEEDRRTALARQVLAETRALAPAPPPHPGGAGSSLPGAEPGAPAPLVVVVEDNVEMNGFIAEVLGERFRVECATDGRTGLELVRRTRPDLVVTDVMMPGMSGDQMLRAIREDASLDLVPVLVLTARADEGLRIRLLRDGAQDLLVKPFVAGELVARAANLVGIKRAREAVATELAARDRDSGRLARLAADRRSMLLDGFERLRTSESLLRLAVAEKEVLLREVHHRVKNNLQIVASLLNLNAGSVGEEAATTLRRCADRVRAMALLHEALYRRHDLAHVDLGDYLADVVDSVRASYAGSGGIRVELGTESIEVDAETALPCGLILHELVVNAFRHAYPGGVGTVRVAVGRGPGGKARVTVEDDGRGLPGGFEIERAETLGLQLVTSLAAQVGGRIEVRRDGGTRVALELAA